MTSSDEGATHYRQPGWVLRRVGNPFIVGLTRLGLSLRGSRILEVPGRSSGEPRQVPVNLLTHEDQEYLVAPRGHTQWVRNVRANDGRLDLLVGRGRTHHIATELGDDAEKIDALRAYLRRWKMEVGVFFEGLRPDSSEEEFLAAAPKHPVFRLDDAPV